MQILKPADEIRRHYLRKLNSNTELPNIALSVIVDPFRNIWFVPPDVGPAQPAFPTLHHRFRQPKNRAISRI